jgi:hypothetical protein
MVELFRRALAASTRFCRQTFYVAPLIARLGAAARRLRFAAVAVPALSSLPGAPVSIYLDFDGNYEPTWGAYSKIVSPPYDRDGDVMSFSDDEREAITQIWQRVAEDFSPFNVNVTTIDPRDYSDGHAVHVVIGGHYADWYHIRVGGVSFADSFSNDMPNVVFVFSRALGGGLPKYVADLVSHEVGHTFGLEEQSVYGDRGQRLRDYNTGESSLWGPLMGNSLAAPRSIWHYGTSTSAGTIQDDVAVIARPQNGFGLRPDDHADQVFSGTRLNNRGQRFEQAGVIGTLRDRDCFILDCDVGGRVELTVAVTEAGANLDAKLELRDSAGTVVATDDPDEQLGCGLEARLPKGRYYAVVASHGSYGDLGQYKIKGRIVPDSRITQIAVLNRSRQVAAVDEQRLVADGQTAEQTTAAQPPAPATLSAPAAGPATR